MFFHYLWAKTQHQKCYKLSKLADCHEDFVATKHPLIMYCGQVANMVEFCKLCCHRSPKLEI